MGASRIFVDTNVLVYANWAGAQRHLEARRRIGAFADAGDRMCVSRQVLREFLAVVSRPQGEVVPMTIAEAAETVGAFERLFDVLNGDVAFPRLLDLVSRYDVKGRVIHDANNVATMLEAGVSRLLTANPSDFRRFADLISIEPL